MHKTHLIARGIRVSYGVIFFVTEKGISHMLNEGILFFTWDFRETLPFELDMLFISLHMGFINQESTLYLIMMLDIL